MTENKRLQRWRAYFPIYGEKQQRFQKHTFLFKKSNIAQKQGVQISFKKSHKMANFV